MSEPERIKLFAVGDGAVGKTSLLITYTTNKFPKPFEGIDDPYLKTVELPIVDKSEKKTKQCNETKSNPSTETHETKRKFEVGMWDPHGGEDFDRLRPLDYPQTDLFLICFAVNSQSSFENVRNRWEPEVTHHMPSTPWILVGTKTDLRTEAEGLDKHVQCISANRAKKEAKALKAVKYVECSALLQEGVEEVFLEAVKAVVADRSNENKKSRNCQLL